MKLLEKIELWEKATAAMDRLKADEIQLRNEIFFALFPVPKEGVNSVEFEGRTVKGTYKINRTVDAAALGSSWQALSEQKIPLDFLIKNKPELVISVFRTLTPEQHLLFDNVLTIKPGSPTLEIK